MYSFLKAEWKTIVGVIIFCGLIFCWFYYQEVQKIKNAEAPYQFECIRAGKGLFDYNLGTPYSELNSKLDGFSLSEDKSLNILRYESPDHTTILNFRKNTLASIEYSPDMTQLDERCVSDRKQLANNSPVSESIKVGNRIHSIYNGYIVVKEEVEDTSNDDTSDDPNDDNEVKSTTSHVIGWIIIPE